MKTLKFIRSKYFVGYARHVRCRVRQQSYPRSLGSYLASRGARGGTTVTTLRRALRSRGWQLGTSIRGGEAWYPPYHVDTHESYWFDRWALNDESNR
jgi:hypothetical protein